MARLHASDSLRTLDLQAHRVRHPDLGSGAFDVAGSQREVDARLLLVAVGWFHRTCAAAATLSSSTALGDAVEHFERSVIRGRAKEMRDIWEHLDEYLQGVGRLQRSSQDTPLGRPAELAVWSWTGSPGTLGSLTWAGVSVDLDLVLAEAHRLNAVLQSLTLSAVPGGGEKSPAAHD